MLNTWRPCLCYIYFFYINKKFSAIFMKAYVSPLNHLFVLCGFMAELSALSVELCVCLGHCGFKEGLELANMGPAWLMFLSTTPIILGLLPFHICLSMPVPIKQFAVSLVKIDVNLQIHLGKTDILIVSLFYYEHSMSLPFLCSLLCLIKFVLSSDRS